MTALGKLLVFVVLMLSLVWNGLVVNAYVTRSNWRAEAEKYRKEYAQQAESANNLRKLLEEERKAGEDSRAVLRVEQDRLYKQYVEADKQYRDLDDKFKKQQASDLKLEAAAKALQGNIDGLNEQVKTQTDLLAKKEKELVTLTLASENAKSEMVKAQLERDAQQQRAERFADRIRELSDSINELRALGGRAPAGFEQRGVAPVGFRGTVRKYEGDAKEGYVSLTPGLDAGLRVGAVLTVFRTEPTAKYVGKVIITQVDPKEAVGRFVPPPASKLGADDLPKPNDELKPE